MNRLKTLKNKVLASLALTSIIFMALVVSLANKTTPVEGSVVVGNECNATSTLNYLATVASSSVIVLRPGQATLCSVIITKADTGTIALFDATTSDITKRASTLGSTTIQIANFPASATAGAYPFNVATKYGLLVVINQPGLGFGVASTTFTSR